MEEQRAFLTLGWRVELTKLKVPSSKNQMLWQSLANNSPTIAYSESFNIQLQLLIYYCKMFHVVKIAYRDTFTIPQQCRNVRFLLYSLSQRTKSSYCEALDAIFVLLCSYF